MKNTARASATALPLAAAMICGSALADTPAASEKTATSENRRHFLPDSRPMTRWWWFASMIREEDIDAQLEWLKANGFGGVEIAWMYPLNIERYTRFYPWLGEEERKIRTPRQEWLSPEWSGIVAHAKRSADRLGLQCDFTFGMAWPFGDGGVSEKDAGQIFGKPEFKQRNLIPWEYPTQGYILDHMNQPAFARYAGRVGAALAEPLKGSRSGLFCDSWEVETDRIWTAGFGEAFKARFGYGIEPFMEKIFTGDDSDARHDYLLLVSESVLKNFYQPFTAKSHELGAFSRVQCHGSPTDLIDAYAAVDVAETEALLYEPNFGRIAASAAALAGHGDVSCETFTCIYGFPREKIRKEQTADLKLLADALFANGVNHIVWHGKPFNPQGSDQVEFYASVHVGPESALAAEFPAFNGYMEKVSAAMKRGQSYAGVAQYLPLEDAWMGGLYPEEKRLKWSWGTYELRYEKHAPELRGYHPLWINHHFLREAHYENGLLHAGPLTFSSLLVDAEHLRSEVLATILDLARQGLPVCMKRHPLQAGKNKCDSFKSNLDALFALANVSESFTKTASRPALVEGDDLPDYWCRVDKGTHLIFFAHPLARNLKHPMAYGQSLTPETLRVPVRIRAGKADIETTLVFAPHQSLLLEIDATGHLRQRDISFYPKPPQRGD